MTLWKPVSNKDKTQVSVLHTHSQNSLRSSFLSPRPNQTRIIPLSWGFYQCGTLLYVLVNSLDRRVSAFSLGILSGIPWRHGRKKGQPYIQDLVITHDDHGPV